MGFGEREIARTEGGPWKLPERWVWATVGDLPMGGGGSVIPNREPNAPFLLYSVPSFESGYPERVTGRSIESNKQIVDPDSILVCKINPRINRVWRVATHAQGEGQVIASTEWIVIRCLEGIEPDYLLHFLSTERVRQYLAANVSGVGGSLMRVNATTVAAIQFPVPPLPEQRRVVDRIDALFAEISEGEAALAEARKGLELFRRSLLKAAVTGKLTRDWRTTTRRRRAAPICWRAYLLIGRPGSRQGGKGGALTSKLRRSLRSSQISRAVGRPRLWAPYLTSTLAQHRQDPIQDSGMA
jgi:hypothetical protein